MALPTFYYPQDTLRDEYKNLRQVIPSLRIQRNVSKIEVVSEAARYIDHLHKSLIEKFATGGIPANLKALLRTDDPHSLDSNDIKNLVTRLASTFAESNQLASGAQSHHHHNSNTNSLTQRGRAALHQQRHRLVAPVRSHNSARRVQRCHYSSAAALTMNPGALRHNSGAPYVVPLTSMRLGHHHHHHQHDNSRTAAATTTHQSAANNVIRSGTHNTIGTSANRYSNNSLAISNNNTPSSVKHTHKKAHTCNTTQLVLPHMPQPRIQQHSNDDNDVAK
ncbi:hypothetical protein GZH46_00867 [Fragariocoptes setiger]|uniref:BHLH domain-containing protein n=1 Tax=Fragariocoptes setiger TaxID=1670756 RepID=A0ABQ7SB23_9ACAR|nr:hypothetical protein GZH46_00867 [Fragariocoptes setiger]